MNNQLSESILQKRIKRFKSIKRGYYSLIAIVIFYVLSLLSPLWINNQALIVYAKNNKWDTGEPLMDISNGIWDDAEEFVDGDGVWKLGESFIDKDFNGSCDPAEEFVDKNNNGKWDDAEKFIDVGNGVWDEGEEFVDITKKDGNWRWEIYDKGEKFIDKPNGKWDDAEKFIDLNNNEKWDEGEEFVDLNNNEIWDEAEKFIDVGNGVWDEGEEFVDLNNNEIWDDDEEFIDTPNGVWDSAEYYTDANLNNQWDDAEEFEDELNGIWDEGEEFVDKNNNGKWDDAEPFYVNFHYTTNLSHYKNVLNSETREKLECNELGGIFIKIEEGNKAFCDIGNGVWDEGEEFVDQYHFYFPALMDLLSFIPGIEEPHYPVSYFLSIPYENADLDSPTDFRVLDELFENSSDNNNFVIMPLYPYHPHEDLKDQLDEKFEDQNNNNKWDWDDKNNNNKCDKNECEPFVDENRNGIWNKNNPPTKPNQVNSHIFGTDNTGRDLFARVVDGFKISITFAIVCTFLSYTIGICIGAMLGYYGRKIDLFGVRLIEIFSSIPFLFVMMILGSIIRPGVYTLAAMLVIVSGWIGVTMYIRGEFYREKSKDYVSAAVSMGASDTQVMFKHILPNALTPVITFAPFAIMGYIGTLNMLDLLGYGLQPPAASWGEIVKQAIVDTSQWHMLVIPIAAMTLTLFMISFIGEAVREAFDPKVYSRLR